VTFRSLLFATLVSGLAALSVPPSRPPGDLRIFFRQTCAACHGLDGSATSPEGQRLKGRDFTSPEAMKGLTDADLETTIRKGLFFGMRMPSYGSQLSDADIKAMVRIIREARRGRPVDPTP